MNPGMFASLCQYCGSYWSCQYCRGQMWTAPMWEGTPFPKCEAIAGLVKEQMVKRSQSADHFQKFLETFREAISEKSLCDKKDIKAASDKTEKVSEFVCAHCHTVLNQKQAMTYIFPYGKSGHTWFCNPVCREEWQFRNLTGIEKAERLGML